MKLMCTTKGGHQGGESGVATINGSVVSKENLTVPVAPLKLILLILLFVATIVGISATAKSFPKKDIQVGEGVKANCSYTASGNEDAELHNQFEMAFLALSIACLLTAGINFFAGFRKQSACWSDDFTNAASFGTVGVFLMIAGVAILSSAVGISAAISNLECIHVWKYCWINEKFAAGVMAITVGIIYFLVGVALFWNRKR